MSVFRVEKNKGYTVMSNHHLRNHTLSLKAKGLLSQDVYKRQASFTLSTYAHATPGMKRESANRMGQYLRRIRESTEASKSSV